jgi:hypothetical protein
MNPLFYVILVVQLFVLPLAAFAEDGHAAANDERQVRDACAEEAKSLQTPAEEFDTYVEVCIEDVKAHQGTATTDKTPRKPAATSAD